MAKDIVVFDLDGTVADITHRLHLVQTGTPNWPRFFKECVNDVPKEWALFLALGMAAIGKKIVVVSARSQEVQKETEEWFAKHWKDIPYELNLIRPQGDYTPDDDMKRAWLNASGIKDRILFIVDDRTRVVDMWRAEGLTCLQCDRWEEFKRPRKSQVMVGGTGNIQAGGDVIIK
jgi:hypothetical protein